MKNTVELLITILLDHEASLTERDDAAIYLEKYENDSVINALLLVAKNGNEDEMILNSCGESIGSLWVKKDFFDENIYKELPKISQHGIYYVIKSRKPQWLKKYNLNP